MQLDDDWARPHTARRGFLDAGAGILRVTLLFGSAAVALALILTPIAEKQADKMLFSSYPSRGLDMMTTGAVGGSIGQRQGESYVVRRSVLQPNPNSVCIIRQNGMRTGDC